MDTSSVREAAKILGGVSKLGAAIDLSTSMVSQLCTGRRPVSVESAIRIDRATGGRIPCEEVRADVAELFSYLRGTERKAV